MRPDVVAFLNDWREKEHAALVAQYTERDADTFARRLADLRALYDDRLQPDIARPSTLDEDWFERGEAMVKGRLMPRVIFQIKEYHHPTLGMLWRCYTSHTTRPLPGRSGYFANDFVAGPPGQFKVISRYHIDDQARTLALDLTDWRYRGGVRLDCLGELTDVEKLQPPDDARDHREYEAE